MALRASTYHGKPCRRCGGTLRYFMRRGDLLGQPGPCVACVCNQTRSADEPARRARLKPQPPKERRPIADPTLGAAFADSIRHMVRAGRA